MVPNKFIYIVTLRSGLYGKGIINEQAGTLQFYFRKMNKRAALRRYILTFSIGLTLIIPYDEAWHGLVRQVATAFPQSIDLSATWDIDLMHKVSKAIAT